MDAATEAAAIARTYDVITRTTGIKPLGWHTRSTPSVNTRRLLQEHGGFLYDSDSYADDLPSWVSVDGHDHLVVPYTLDTNDMRFATPQGFNTGDDFLAYCRDAFDVLHAEGEVRKNLVAQRYGDVLESVGTLRGDVAALFDATLVNDPDPHLRRQRHLLLRKVRDLVGEIADFSAIQG